MYLFETIVVISATSIKMQQAGFLSVPIAIKVHPITYKHTIVVSKNVLMKSPDKFMLNLLLPAKAQIKNKMPIINMLTFEFRISIMNKNDIKSDAAVILPKTDNIFIPVLEKTD